MRFDSTRKVKESLSRKLAANQSLGQEFLSLSSSPSASSRPNLARCCCCVDSFQGTKWPTSGTRYTTMSSYFHHHHHRQILSIEVIPITVIVIVIAANMQMCNAYVRDNWLSTLVLSFELRQPITVGLSLLNKRRRRRCCCCCCFHSIGNFVCFNHLNDAK